MGRSRGGLTSKLHALVDAQGRPVTLHLTAGQIADCQEAEALIEIVGEGDIVLGDKGYDTNAIRAKLAVKKAWANIPPKTNRRGTFVFSKWVYRQRNLIERFFNRIKQFRGIATRYDKDPANFLAAVKLVAAKGWCRSL
jgi:transposase